MSSLVHEGPSVYTLTDSLSLCPPDRPGRKGLCRSHFGQGMLNSETYVLLTWSQEEPGTEGRWRGKEGKETGEGEEVGIL